MRKFTLLFSVLLILVSILSSCASAKTCPAYAKVPQVKDVNKSL